MQDRKDFQLATKMADQFDRELRQKLHEASDFIEDFIAAEPVTMTRFRAVVKMLMSVCSAVSEIEIVANRIGLDKAAVAGWYDLRTDTSDLGSYVPTGDVAKLLTQALLSAVREQIGTRPVARASNDSSRQRVVADESLFIGGFFDDNISEEVPEGPVLPDGIDYDASLETLPGWDDLSPRLRNMMKNSKYQTLRPVLAATPGQLLRIPNFGRKSLKELLRWLAIDMYIWGGTLLSHPNAVEELTRSRAGIEAHAKRSQAKADAEHLRNAHARGGSGG